MKQIFISFLVMFSTAIIIGYCVAQKSKKADVYECNKIDKIRIAGDSICGLPFFGTIYGVRLLDSSSTFDNGVRHFKMYIEKLKVEQELGKWYPIDDCVIKIEEVSGCITESYQGLPNTEDSLIIVRLKNRK